MAEQIPEGVQLGMLAWAIPTALTFAICGYLLIYIGTAKYKLFKKAGQPGWAVFVPIYNNYIIYKIAGKSKKYFYCSFIPLVSTYQMWSVVDGLGQAFGKPKKEYTKGFFFYGFLLAFLDLGYGPDKYIGINPSKNQTES